VTATPAKDAAVQAIENKAASATPAVPAAVTQAVDAANSGKAAVEAVPTTPGAAIETIKNKASQKATQKALDLLK
jgi:hypothetical protein